MEKYFAGLDVSTQSLKIIVISLSDELIVYEDHLSYDNDLPKYGTVNGSVSTSEFGSSESDPLMWVEAIHILFQRLQDTNRGLVKSIRCISVSGQQHGLVGLEKNGNLSRAMSKLWNDVSSHKECELMTSKIGGMENMIKEIANTQRPGYTASKIFHMYQNERTAFDNTETFLLVHNYINWFLTGGISTMEYGDASGTALWDPISKKWSELVCNIISSDLYSKLPNVVSPTKSIGYISKVLCDKYGFSDDCKIDAGSGDNMYSAVGTGNIEPGIVTISLGTSGTAFTIMEKPYIDMDGEIACFCDSTGNYLPLLCISNMAGGYNTFLKENNLSHTNFNELLSFTRTGNEGKLIVPWFEGERTPDLPNAAPIYFGFGIDELSKEFIARGLIEGHIMNLYQGFKKMPINPEVIHLTGGLARSESWVQMIADVFECTAVPISGEGAALGAAIHAAWVYENEEGNHTKIYDLAMPFINYDEKMRRSPNEQNARLYKKLLPVFESVCKRSRGIKSEDPFILKKQFMEYSHNVF